MGEGEGKILPSISYVNWFNQGPDGSCLWPGYGDNIRVLEWIFNRSMGHAKAESTPIGYIPSEDALNLSGLNISKEKLRQILQVDKQAWIHEAAEMREYYQLFGDRLPSGLSDELKSLEKRLQVI